LCKELLGAVRQKYSTVPIPGGEVTLDGAELRSEGAAEKEALVSQLREMLESMTVDKQLEANANKSDKTNEVLKKIPNLIYIASLMFAFIWTGI
jgi:ABC-type branched-subunit amino acid transport system ATPase component